MHIESIGAYYRMCRVESWTSWMLSFAVGGILFGLPSWTRFVVVLSAFALSTAFIFVINQYFDRETDKNNRIKRSLPLASQKLSPNASVTFAGILASASLLLVVMVDPVLLVPFAAYLLLGITYSAPVPNLKTVPIADFMVSAMGAGFLPFYIGLSTAGRTDLDPVFIVLMSIPLMVYQSGGHIVQAMGDYSADKTNGLSTFPVRFGQRKAAMLASFFLLTAIVSSALFVLTEVIYPIELLPALLLMPWFLPALRDLLNLYEHPSEESSLRLQRTAKKTRIYIVIMIASSLVLRLLPSLSRPA